MTNPDRRWLAGAIAEIRRQTELRVPAGREKALALAKLDEARLWAGEAFDVAEDDAKRKAERS